MGRLEGKVAFITGGARGIGRAEALILAEEGADVAIVDIAVSSTARSKFATRESLEETVSEVRALGRKAIGLIADVSKDEEVRSAAETVTREFGQIDVLVATAGIGLPFQYAWEVSEETWDRVVDIDLKGAWLTAKYVVPHMITRGSGRVIFISSQAGLKGYPGIAPYCAAKFGVIGLMKSLAIELAPHGINVNAVCPGSVDTEGNRQVATEMGVSFEEMVSTFTSKQLIGSVMQPEMIARAVLYLASPDGDFITGHALAVDGGATTK
jgi:NAD(P)-dependent dehydrogenase (short-subunit alcohol dehydrogenase family)